MIPESNGPVRAWPVLCLARAFRMQPGLSRLRRRGLYL
jgi:hypothetical protein